MQNHCKVLMIGPDADSLGGISAVIKMYKTNNLYNSQVLYLSTYISGNVISILSFYIKFLARYIFMLATNRNIKLIHIHTASRGSFLRKFIAFKIAKIFKKKVLFNIHPIWFTTFYNKSNKLIKKLITFALNDSDLILVLSNKIKSEVSEVCENQNIKILYNPVQIKEINQNESENINAFFMGKLCKEKGIYDILNAAEYISSPNVKLNLYGDGNISELNANDKVEFYSWISGDEKGKVFKNSDILILPSYSEGLPMSILEAMAYGKPIISTPVGGIPEAVEEGLNGFLIQPGDYKALAEKIDLLASDKDLREKMGQESYRIAKEKFDIKVISKQLEEIYDSLLK